MIAKTALVDFSPSVLNIIEPQIALLRCLRLRLVVYEVVIELPDVNGE